MTKRKDPSDAPAHQLAAEGASVVVELVARALADVLTYVADELARRFAAVRVEDLMPDDPGVPTPHVRPRVDLAEVRARVGRPELPDAPYGMFYELWRDDYTGWAQCLRGISSTWEVLPDGRTVQTW